MKLKKLFTLELGIGLILLIIITLLFFTINEFGKMDIPFYLFAAISVIYGMASFNRKLCKDANEWQLFKKAVTLSVWIAMPIIIISVTIIGRLSTYHLGHFEFYWTIALIYTIRATIGLFLFILYPYGMPILPSNKKSIDQESVSFLMINYQLFILMTVGGIIILAVSIYMIKNGYSYLEPLAMPAAIIFYTAAGSFTNAVFHKKRIMDEREKYFIFKTTSIASFLNIVLLLVLFAVKDFQFFGYSTNQIWGIMITPLFMLLWGCTGFVLLTKEEGGLIDALRKD